MLGLEIHVTSQNFPNDHIVGGGGVINTLVYPENDFSIIKTTAATIYFVNCSPLYMLHIVNIVIY